jgi:uncharacterized repeat protein (TIGR02543 family)
VSRTAIPASDKYAFFSWTGGGGARLGVEPTLQLTLGQDTVVTANFGSLCQNTEAGKLGETLGELAGIERLAVEGVIDARDVKYMRDNMPNLKELDLSAAAIEAYSGTEGTVTSDRTYPANELPTASFSGKYVLISVKLPAGLTAIGDSAFKSSGLRYVYFPASGFATVGDEAFMGCTALEEATLLSGITAIGQRAFKGCTELKSISLPAGLTAIGANAFESSGLTEVTIPGTAAIGDEAFKSCTALEEATLLSGITTVGQRAFKGCTGLKSISLPDGLTAIGDNAFESSGLTEVVIPGTAAIGENAFKSCTELKEVTLLNGITVIGDSAFNGCNGIDTVINLSLIPQIIDTSVFYGVSLGATVLLIPDTCGVDLCKDIYAVADVWKGFHPHIFASATVTYNSRGGTSVDNKQIMLYRLATFFESSRDNYRFTGWYKDVSCIDKWDFENDQVVHNITLYAGWIRQYTVSFVSNNGNSVVDTIVDSLTTVAAPAVPHRTSYRFTGWYKEADCTDKWSFETDTVVQDTTLYAGWIRQYTVRFNSMAGSSVSDTIVDSSTMVTKPADPHRHGHFLKSWCKEMTCVNSWNFTVDKVTQDTMLFAKWEVKHYKVTFESNGGSSVKDTLIDSLTVVEKPADPHRVGYNFMGWYKDNGTFVNEWNFETDTVTKPIALYAKWEIKKYKVTFNSNGGSAVTDTSVDSLTVVNEPAVPHRVGYIFQGWYSMSAEDSITWSFETDTVTQDTTLYAKWKIKQYAVNFVSNGGSDVAPYLYVDSLTAIMAPFPVPHLHGHDLAGWYTDVTFNEEWDFAVDRVTQDTTLYAKWEIKKYNVTFNSNGDSAVTDTLVDSLTVVNRPAAPHRVGYNFQEWYKDADCTEEWNFTTDTVTQDTTLYALWEIKKYTVTFASNGGSAVAPLTEVDSLKKINEPAEPHFLGHDFKGWYKDDVTFTEKWEFTTDTVTQHTTLYALWEIKKYAVTFESNGGSNVEPWLNVDSLSKIAKPADPHFLGHDLVGWYKDDVTFTDDWSFNEDSVTQNITLYAKWKIKSYTVHFVSNGGSDVTDTLVDSLTVVTRPAVPHRVGYIFQNWYKDADCTDEWDFTTDKVTQDTTLYADWEIKHYTVTFESNGGSFTGSQMIDSLNKVNPVDNPHRVGYDFTGWYKDADCTEGNIWILETDSVTQSITLYAGWEIKHYTVTFNSNGGSDVGDTLVDSLTVVSRPADPTRAEYIFAGWYRDAAYASAWNFASDVVTANTTLYARWISVYATTYAVAFESNGGSAVDPQTVEEGGKVAQVTAPAYPGHNFKGWYGDEELTAAWDFATNTVTQDTTLYAKWIATYTVTFNVGEGSSVDPQPVEEGDKVTQPNAPTRIGYAFAGWYRDAAFTSVWSFTSDRVTQDTTLYAKWISGTATTYAVAFESYEGSAVDPQTVEANGKVAQVTAPVYPGHNFKGWYGDAECTEKWDFETNTVTQDTTLYAKWIATYTVTFSADEGSSVDPQTVEEGDKVAQPADPTRADYIFAGWYRDAAYASAWNFASDVVTANTTLYARWISVYATTYTVAFESNGGSAVDPQTVEEGGKVAQVTAPAYPGHNFKGWYGDEECTEKWDFETDTVTQDTTLYAKWAAIYTVTFNSNGGSAVDPQEVEVEEGDKVTQPNAPNRVGYAFAGWYRDAAYASAWNFASDVVTANTTLYAKWALVYTVTFTANGGSDISPQTVAHGSTAAQPAAPTRDGYAFMGWYKEATLTTLWNFANDVVTANITLYAKWVGAYTVTFNTNHGSIVNLQMVPVGGKVAQPDNPTRAGYTFVGWYSDETFASAWDFNATVAGDMTLYAKWNDPSSTGVEGHALSVARVYPNPTSGEVTIESEGAEARLYSSQGVLLKRTHSNRLDLSGYPAGVYLLRTGGKAAKVVKQ